MALTAKQIEALKALPLMGQYSYPLGRGEGSPQFFVGDQSLTRTLNALSRVGLVEIADCPRLTTASGMMMRCAEATLTDAGRAALG